jgi:hypothetical protein
MRPVGFTCTFVILAMAPIKNNLQARTWLTDNFIANGNGCSLGQGTEVSTQLDTLEIIMRDMQILLPSYSGLPFAERKFCNFSLGIESVMSHYPTKFVQNLTFGVHKNKASSGIVIAQSSVGDVPLPPLEALLPAGTELDEEGRTVELAIDLTAGIVDANTWCTNTHSPGNFASRVVVQGLRTSDADSLIVGHDGSRQPLRFSAHVEWLPCSEPTASTTVETAQIQQ